MVKCKRMSVYCIGQDRQGNIAAARNGNETECKNIVGACGCIHAEINLLKKLDNIKIILLSHSPCLNCAHALLDKGLEAVIFLKSYRKTEGIDFLMDNNVTIMQVGEV